MSMMQRVTTLSSPIDLTGRTALVVGATAGIGASVARQLAEMGATTIITGRDAAKLERSLAELEAIAPGRVHAVLADLADLAAVRRAADALCSAHPRLDIVIANASVQFAGKHRSFTKDGFEATFGVNHLGNAALLMALERPIRAAGGRVVIVASEAHRRAKGLPLDNLMGEHGFDGALAYNRSKLANILFARQLAVRWPDVSVYAAHPGAVLTDMMFRAVAGHWLFRLMFLLIRWQLLTPDESAKGIVRIAADPALAAASGAYFEIGRPCQSSPLADDARLGQQLFDATTAYLNQ